MKSTLLIRIYCSLLLLPVMRPASAQGLIIPSGAYVIANNGNIVTTANWVNNGSFTHNGGTLIFAGSVQTLGGASATQFNNLTIAAGSNTTILSPGQMVSGIVLSNDTLNANGNLTLLSTAVQTALVSGSGTGEVIGKLTMQRYLPSGFGYKYFSSPFIGDTVNDFSSEINLATSFPDVYSFNESLSSAGWVNYTNPSGLLTPLAGYAVNFGTSPAPLTVSLRGVVSNHAVSTGAIYNHNMPYTQGFNLVGNPYPSPVDWNAVGGWTKTNVDNAIYFFSNGTVNQYTGTYSSYVNGISSNGIASNIIAAMQGFFVHVSNGTFPVAGLLAVNNTARNLNLTTVFFGYTVPQAPSPFIRLSAGFYDEGPDGDPAVFYFKAGADGTFDKTLDALKLMNTHTGIPNLYAVAKDTARLSIYALPDMFDSVETVPLGLTTAQDGWISFKATDIENIPVGLYVYLSDTKTGVKQDLLNAAPYRLYLTSGEYKNRFFLNFSTKEPAAGGTPGTPSNGPFQAYGAGGTLFVNGNLNPGEKGEVRVFDLQGQLVLRGEISGSTYQPFHSNFASGIYLVSLSTPAGTQTKKILIGTR
ncbi:MAG TPA: T9SS type A sorting domain-containing protein [Puia sp.]|nr:T9SS type A sorting domain-containing protein [Puia sp.]